MHERKPQGDHHPSAEYDQDRPADRLAKGAESSHQMAQFTVPLIRPCSPRDVEMRVRQVMGENLEGRHQS